MDQIQEFRYDEHGQIRLLAEAEGYILARRKGEAAFVITRAKWDQYQRNPPRNNNITGPTVFRLNDYRKP